MPGTVQALNEGLLVLKQPVPLVKNLPRYLLGKLWICAISPPAHSSHLGVLKDASAQAGQTIKSQSQRVGFQAFHII